MRLADLTSPQAVLAALAECDALGRDVFLKRHGYKYSRLYPLRYNGRIYDSKAIVGVAYGKQHGSPLRHGEFSGGLATVVPLLRRLGFDAQVAPHPLSHLAVGASYERKQLLEMFGGQLQRGIWTPREFPVVLLFSGKSGAQYGYQDHWTSEGVFRYTGEGQRGDMTFDEGNKAIQDHRLDRKDLLLFEDLGKGKGVRFAGVFECIGWNIIDGKGKQEASRKLIVFDLVAVATAAGASPTPLPPTVISAPLSDLRQQAYEAAMRPGMTMAGEPRSKLGTRAVNRCERMCLPGLKGSARPVIQSRLSNVVTGRRTWSLITRRGWPMRVLIIRQPWERFVPPAIGAFIPARMARRGTSG